ncbi:MAG: alpha/beta hydrolase [Verrucomicrobiota bacterium]
MVEAREPIPLWAEGEVPFLKAGDEENAPVLYRYSAEERENHNGAAVVICPGGGYGGLAKDHEGHQPAQWFQEEGVSAYVLHYRLGSQGYHYPTQLADVQRAVRLVRSQAEEHGVDPNRIAVMGFSAGGHLASMSATLYDEEAYDHWDGMDEVSARPDFAILCYPVISLDLAVTHRGSRKNLLGPDRAESDVWAKKLSSDRNVTSETPPTFLFQTDADAAVPAENAVRFYLALREKGVKAEFHSFQDGPHGVGLYRGDPTLGVWSELLRNWLRANSFFAPRGERVAASGEVTLDGVPISWGVLTFHPEDTSQPVVSVRVRRGKFSSEEATGPFAGKATLSLEGSIWETTGDENDRAIELKSLERGGDPIEVNMTEGMDPIRLSFRSR